MMMKDDYYKFKIGEKVKYPRFPDKPFEVIDRYRLGFGIYYYIIYSPETTDTFKCVESELDPWSQKTKTKHFKIGDIVLVAGYLITDYWKVTGYVEEDDTFGSMHEVINIKTSYKMLACTEDMSLVNKEEAEEIINKHISKEKQILKKLAENKKKIEKLKGWNDGYFELFLFTKNKKYLRRIEKLNKIISKIPTRAYEIK